MTWNECQKRLTDIIGDVELAEDVCFFINEEIAPLATDVTVSDAPGPTLGIHVSENIGVRERLGG